MPTALRLAFGLFAAVSGGYTISRQGIENYEILILIGVPGIIGGMIAGSWWLAFLIPLATWAGASIPRETFITNGAQRPGEEITGMALVVLLSFIYLAGLLPALAGTAIHKRAMQATRTHRGRQPT